MALCKRCLGQFHDELVDCPRCGIPLLRESLAQKSARSTLDLSVHREIRRTRDRGKALAMVGHLQAAGVPAHLLDFDPSVKEDVFRVLVSRRAVDDAELILRDLVDLQSEARIEDIKRRDPRETLDMPPEITEELGEGTGDAPSGSGPVAHPKETVEMNADDIQAGIARLEVRRRKS